MKANKGNTGTIGIPRNAVQSEYVDILCRSVMNMEIKD